MEIHTRKLLTIVTESVIEGRITRDILDLGANGYTIMDVRGKGSRGVRSAGWDASSNIRIEVVCELEVAKKIAAHLKEHYYANFAMSLFLLDVGVWRPEKF
jgi:nitrogen regulatory protein PII